MVVQSDWLPMQMATLGRVAAEFDMGRDILVSGNDVGKDLAFHQSDFILQHKLALLQPLQL